MNLYYDEISKQIKFIFYRFGIEEIECYKEKQLQYLHILFELSWKRNHRIGPIYCCLGDIVKSI